MTSSSNKVALNKSNVLNLPGDPERDRWIIDEHKDAPTGFGLRITPKGHRSYFLQRRVGNKVTRVSLGSVDSIALPQARLTAKEFSEQIAQGIHPKKEIKKRQAQEAASVGAWTLDQCFDHYIEHLKIKRKTTELKANTLNSLNVARRRLLAIEGWANKPLKELTGQEVYKAFVNLTQSKAKRPARKTPDHKVPEPRREISETKVPRDAIERAFTWASTVVKVAMVSEQFDLDRPPSLSINPFSYLNHRGALRSRTELEKARAQARNPMSHELTGQFITALWAKRPSRPTACDYLLLTLFWGTRANEATVLRWGDDLSASERMTNSCVVLDPPHGESPYVFFHDTKNNADHRLPLTPRVEGLLRSRRGLHPDSQWVFPAESPKSKKAHFSDARTTLEYLTHTLKCPQLTRHDLRRTFGREAERQDFSTQAIKRLLNHTEGGVTFIYTTPEWATLKERLQRIESAFLETAPQVRDELDRLANPIEPA